MPTTENIKYQKKYKMKVLKEIIYRNITLAAVIFLVTFFDDKDISKYFTLNFLYIFILYTIGNIIILYIKKKKKE